MKVRVMERFRGWRTIGFNVGMGLVAVLLSVAPILLEMMAIPEVIELVPEEWRTVWMILLPLGNIYFRQDTYTPVGKKEVT